MTTTPKPAETLPADGFLAHALERLEVSLGKFDRRGKVTVFLLSLMLIAGAVAYVSQLRNGLKVTAMSDVYSWGIYIVTFVFFIGISMAGTLISAMLRLTNASWRAPITRMAECITVCALLVAGPMIIVDMGRPDRVLYTLTHARVQSPILWDVLSLSTYLAGSLLYFYLPLIPDVAILRDQGAYFSPWRRKLYTLLALGWHGSPKQRHHLERAVAVMAIAIIPVAVSIHTVTAWLFGLTLRPGWHSTIIGPDFVVGAIYSGTAAVITFMALFRMVFRLGRYIEPLHFKKLGLLLLAFNVIYFYFMVNEFIGGAYTKETRDLHLQGSIFSGAFALQFWFMAVVGLLLPAILLIMPWTRNVKGIVAASLLVNIGMWIKRYIIVVPTLGSPFMPLMRGTKIDYSPTLTEWTITAASFAAFGMLYITFSKLFPIVSLWELQEAHEHETAAAAAQTATAPAAGKAAVVALLLLAFIAPRTARAAASAAAPVEPPPVPTLAIEARTEGKDHLLFAIATAAGKPVSGVTITFRVKRSFGAIELGHDTTLDDGSAAIPFPEKLPGSPDNRLVIQAEITAPAQYAGILGGGEIPAGVTRPAAGESPRELWSTRPPRLLLATVIALTGLVVAAYGFVILQIKKIKQEVPS